MSSIRFKDNRCPCNRWGKLPSPPNVKKRICLDCKKIQTLTDYSKVDRHGRKRNAGS